MGLPNMDSDTQFLPQITFHDLVVNVRLITLAIVTILTLGYYLNGIYATRYTITPEVIVQWS